MDRRGPMGVVSLVCITCGNEKTFSDAVPASVTCERCGSTVFRQFATPTVADEATISQLEEQARGMAYGEPSPETTRDDVRDLDSR
jgi:DNA-directed RNA polymerase subunit RPC12/RpoP